MQSDCIILGGGASGLCAAAWLGRQGMRVTVLERLGRAGKKLLATGNGRCNLSNTAMDANSYGNGADFVRCVYGVTPPRDVLAFFASLGLMTTVEDGRIYPRTLSAASVLDVLRMACERENVTIVTDCEAVGLTPSRRGGWSVQAADGRGFFALHALVAMGGSAAPGMGTDGAGTRLLAQLGHRITPLYPALVQLRCDHPALRALRGIRIQAKLTLLVNDVPAASEQGELLFADYGVSGVCVFQLSRHVGPALQKGDQVRLLCNLLPEIAPQDVMPWLLARTQAFPAAPMQALFTGVFARLLAQTLLRQAGISPTLPAGQLTHAQAQALCGAISTFPLPVTGTQGFSSAQVTRGGVALSDVDPCTMASRLFPGLYIAGEALDIDGPCGGYNLHFAFASALTAARSIAGA